MKYSDEVYKCCFRYAGERDRDPKQHYWHWEPDSSDLCRCGKYKRIICDCQKDCLHNYFHYRVEKVK